MVQDKDKPGKIKKQDPEKQLAAKREDYLFHLYVKSKSKDSSLHIYQRTNIALSAIHLICTFAGQTFYHQ